jgi:hypothetical protein
MAQRHDRMCALHAVVVWPEQAAECRADTERGEVVAGHEHAFGVGGLSAVREVGAEVAVRRHPQSIAVEPLEITKQWITENGIQLAAITSRS